MRINKTKKVALGLDKYKIHPHTKSDWVAKPPFARAKLVKRGDSCNRQLLGNGAMPIYYYCYEKD